MVAKNSKKWGDRVRVVGLGIDTVKAKQLQFIEDSKSTAFEHYNVKNETSTAIKYFGLKRVPTCAIIDKQGKIAMLGHPNKRTLDEDINKILSNRKLEGVGTTNL